MRIFFFHLLIYDFFYLKIKDLARLYSKQHFCWKHRSSLSFRINEIKKYKIIIKYNKKIPRRRKKTWQYNVLFKYFFLFIYLQSLKILCLWAKKMKILELEIFGWLLWFFEDFWVGLVKSLLISSMGFKKMLRKVKFIERAVH